MLTSDPAMPARPSRALQMGEAYFNICAEKCSCRDIDLLAEGFSRDEIARYHVEATQYAKRRSTRDVNDDPQETREQLLGRALRLCHGLLPQPLAIHHLLRNASPRLSNTQIADIWDDLLAGMATDLQHAPGVPA